MNKIVSNQVLCWCLALSSLFLGCAGPTVKAKFSYVPNPVLFGCVSRIGAAPHCSEEKDSLKAFSTQVHESSSTSSSSAGGYTYSSSSSKATIEAVATMDALQATGGDKSLDIRIQSIRSNANHVFTLGSMSGESEVDFNGFVFPTNKSENKSENKKDSKQ